MSNMFSGYGQKTAPCPLVAYKLCADGVKDLEYKEANINSNRLIRHVLP